MRFVLIFRTWLTLAYYYVREDWPLCQTWLCMVQVAGHSLVCMCVCACVCVRARVCTCARVCVLASVYGYVYVTCSCIWNFQVLTISVGYTCTKKCSYHYIYPSSDALKCQDIIVIAIFCICSHCCGDGMEPRHAIANLPGPTTKNSLRSSIFDQQQLLHLFEVVALRVQFHDQQFGYALSPSLSHTHTHTLYRPKGVKEVCQYFIHVSWPISIHSDSMLRAYSASWLWSYAVRCYNLCVLDSAQHLFYNLGLWENAR